MKRKVKVIVWRQDEKQNYRAGGKMKTKMMRKGKASGMSVAKLRAEAKKKGYKLVKS